MNGNGFLKRATTMGFGSRRSERGCELKQRLGHKQLDDYSITDPSSPVQSTMCVFVSSGDYLPSIFCMANSDRQRIADRYLPARPPIALWPNARACARAGDGGIGPTDIGIATCFGPPGVRTPLASPAPMLAVVAKWLVVEDFWDPLVGVLSRLSLACFCATFEGLLYNWVGRRMKWLAYAYTSHIPSPPYFVCLSSVPPPSTAAEAPTDIQVDEIIFYLFSVSPPTSILNPIQFPIARDSAGLSSWPRMQSGLKNPFQNAPGPFIYALPNLAGTCPFSFEDTILFCPFSGVGDSNKALDSNPNPDPDPHHHHHHHHHRGCHNPAVTSPCCHHHDPPPSESAEPHTAPTEEGAPPDTESPLLPPPPSPRTSASPSPDESHFDLPLGDYIISPLAEDGSEPGQQLEPQASGCLASHLPRHHLPHYRALRGPTLKKGLRKRQEREWRRKRRRGHGTSAPLFPLPPAMSHHHPVGFVVPSNCPAPQFWMVPVVPAPGFVGVSLAC
ncbi:hypothetical protein BGY98DRAFT_936217 [Russula aff. rugulosa BPL654]|nr:hypothetical protein BGY98DRAFT_936217 [Russula aff. rugulosa BPL654]